MPSRKAEQIVRVLRSEILSGQHAPGAKLPTYDLLPSCQAPGLARVAIWAPVPHAALPSPDLNALIERACDRLLEKGRRIAVISPHAPNLERAQEYLAKRGFAKDRLWALHVA